MINIFTSINQGEKPNRNMVLFPRLEVVGVHRDVRSENTSCQVAFANGTVASLALPQEEIINKIWNVRGRKDSILGMEEGKELFDPLGFASVDFSTTLQELEESPVVSTQYFIHRQMNTALLGHANSSNDFCRLHQSVDYSADEKRVEKKGMRLW